MPPAAIVLSAGGPEGASDALRAVDGGTALVAVLRTLAAVPVAEVVVVLGADAASVRDRVDFGLARSIDAPDPRGPMISSIRAGLAAVSGEASGALIWPVDRPLVSIATIRTLLAAHAEGAAIAVPIYDIEGEQMGLRGHPVLFARALFDALIAAPDGEGAASLVRARAAEVREIPVIDRGILVDIGSPGAAALLRTMRERARRITETRRLP